MAPQKKKDETIAEPEQKAKATAKSAESTGNKRRKKLADDAIEQLPPEQVAQYQQQWTSLGFSKPKDTKNADTVSKGHTAETTTETETLPWFKFMFRF